MIFWPFELLYSINSALGDASENAGEEKDFSELHWRARYRIRLFNLGEWWHWWRWFYFFKRIRHIFRMWLHYHNFLCRCISYYKEHGEHSDNCPKSKKKKKIYYSI